MSVYATNKRARFDYEILDSFEAGIELSGFETKAVRLGKINLAGSQAIVRNNQVWLVNAEIAPYQPKNLPPEFSAGRTKRLLLRREEIKALLGKTQEKGLTIIPLSVYSKAGRIKIELGLARRKKKADQREAIKKREAKREMESTLKR